MCKSMFQKTTPVVEFSLVVVNEANAIETVMLLMLIDGTVAYTGRINRGTAWDRREAPHEQLLSMQ